MDAVRFYWQKGQAELPLDAVPDQDRSPLRIQRLILCHPNLAKAPTDVLLVNPSGLPKLTVKFGRWEEAPTVARLFLRAFGGEATTAADCATARRELAAWLASRSQPEMAAVARHFSAFPFGVRSETLDVINIWRKILVKGERERIDRFLVGTQQRFESLGWVRDSEREASWNSDPRQINRFYCWLGGRGPKPEVMLCLNRATDRRIRGSSYDILWSIVQIQ